MTGKSAPSSASEWRTLSLDTSMDIVLFRSPRKNGESGIQHGTDLFAHTAPGGTIYFYLWHWSEKPGETNICQLISEDSACHFVLNLWVEPEIIRGLDRENIARYLTGLDGTCGRVAGS